MGVVEPGNALEEHLLLPRLVHQKLLRVLRLPSGMPRTFTPCWAAEAKDHLAKQQLQVSTRPGHLLDPTGFNATSIPHLGLAVVHVDVGVCGQLFFHRRVHFVQPTRGVNVIQERHHVFLWVSPSEETDFGQSRFGHADLANVGQSNFGQSNFGHPILANPCGSGVCVMVGPKGGAQT